MNASAQDVNNAIFGYSEVLEFSLLTDVSTGFYDLKLKLGNATEIAIVLFCRDVSNLSLTKFGGGLTQVLALRATDVSENQLDRVAIHFRDVESGEIEFDCSSIVVEAEAEHNPGNPPIETDTDWDRVNAMTDEEVHAAALSDPDAQPIPRGTDEELAKIGLYRFVNTKRLRDRVGLTQEEFSARYRIPVGTLRDWEQGRKFPDPPARAYLTVIEKDPSTVAILLGKTAS
ncbi:MAG TPA: helix-turn-helix domain-containing protein [Terracidiphilus sp.]|jgi:putative transcriptional regulator